MSSQSSIISNIENKILNPKKNGDQSSEYLNQEPKSSLNNQLSVNNVIDNVERDYDTIMRKQETTIQVRMTHAPA
jgi:hypothetical protein